MNKPLPVLTPSWVERAREMIKENDKDAKRYNAGANFGSGLFSMHRSYALVLLLREEGYKENRVELTSNN